MPELHLHLRRPKILFIVFIETPNDDIHFWRKKPFETSNEVVWNRFEMACRWSANCTIISSDFTRINATLSRCSEFYVFISWWFFSRVFWRVTLNAISIENVFIRHNKNDCLFVCFTWTKLSIVIANDSERILPTNNHIHCIYELFWSNPKIEHKIFSFEQWIEHCDTQ